MNLELPQNHIFYGENTVSTSHFVHIGLTVSVHINHGIEHMHGFWQEALGWLGQPRIAKWTSVESYSVTEMILTIELKQ